MFVFFRCLWCSLGFSSSQLGNSSNGHSGRLSAAAAELECHFNISGGVKKEFCVKYTHLLIYIAHGKLAYTLHTTTHTPYTKKYAQMENQVHAITIYHFLFNTHTCTHWQEHLDKQNAVEVTTILVFVWMYFYAELESSLVEARCVHLCVRMYACLGCFFLVIFPAYLCVCICLCSVCVSCDFQHLIMQTIQLIVHFCTRSIEITLGFSILAIKTISLSSCLT